jgi:phosphonopyruvate decarboxylase
MIDPKEVYNIIANNGIEFFTGVPDSLLKSFNSCVSESSSPENNIIAANEGASVGLAAGYHLATGKIPLVYLQNSGLGNLINPLLSLADHKVYSIPVLIVVGWRGQPNVKDEPQHIKQGEVTLDLLKAMDMPYYVLDENSIENIESDINRIVDTIQKEQSPYFIIVPKGFFSDYKTKSKPSPRFDLKREEALKIIVDQMGEKDIIVSTTGKTSRELFEYRKELGQSHENDFLTVGSMGHASQIALGIALNKPNLKVYCFDGDGAVLMHMGALPIIGDLAPQNYFHILFNNGSHESVGGQPTVGYTTNFLKIAEASGYKKIYKAIKKQDIEIALQDMRNSEGPVLLEIMINQGSRMDLGRPTLTTLENKLNFMKKLKNH